jgi:hypothetical protein
MPPMESFAPQLSIQAGMPQPALAVDAPGAHQESRPDALILLNDMTSLPRGPGAACSFLEPPAPSVRRCSRSGEQPTLSCGAPRAVSTPR